MSGEVFRTFWHGPRLTWIARLCLSSFTAKGHRVELFSYEPVDDVPSGVVIRDAAEILPCKQLFLYRGGEAEVSAPSLHSNLFRYKLLRDFGDWWIDADVLLLDGEIPMQVPLFGRGEDWTDAENKKRPGFGTAVMRFPAGAEIMARAYAEAAVLAPGNPAWGTTGPYLFTRLVEEFGLGHYALPQSKIYPVPYKEAYKFVRTEYREEIERRTNSAPFVHLFQHMLRLSGTSDESPPAGSFLGSRYRRFRQGLSADAMAGEPTGILDNLQPKHRDLMQTLSGLQCERDQLKRRADQVAAELADVSRQRDMLSCQLEQAILRVRALEREAPRQRNAGAREIPADEMAIRSFSVWIARRRILFGLARRSLARRNADVRLIVDQSLRAHGIPDVLSAMAIDWLSAPRVILGLARRRALSKQDAVQNLVVARMRQYDLERRFRALEAAKLADEKALLAAQITIARLRGPAAADMCNGAAS